MRLLLAEHPDLASEADPDSPVAEQKAGKLKKFLAVSREHHPHVDHHHMTMMTMMTAHAHRSALATTVVRDDPPPLRRASASAYRGIFLPSVGT